MQLCPVFFLCTPSSIDCFWQNSNQQSKYWHTYSPQGKQALDMISPPVLTAASLWFLMNAVFMTQIFLGTYFCLYCSIYQRALSSLSLETYLGMLRLGCIPFSPIYWREIWSILLFKKNMCLFLMELSMPLDCLDKRPTDISLVVTLWVLHIWL